MKRADLERDVRHLSWPQPGADLRARVLSAVPVVEQPVPWWDRVWFSRLWRLCAAGIVAALIAAESFVDRSVPDPTTTSARAADARALDEVGRDLGLPADLTAALAKRVASSSATTGQTDLKAQLRNIDGEGDR
jgi:hypothetical protein